ncbi:hypothetical protein [Streptomyces sp. UNOC14_S4]|uniref:hypothetical protein n=1 Tax=Streptomyces sp. UNOC14_S4 TaxID=2872340 RepID=UPI001E5D1E8D|nr:hypothetical protein [Streptomyces sp. UNOC14_S4]MCC3766022.1 hypothetical protein [Streptomyces sp. UNOC14_S4]
MAATQIITVEQLLVLANRAERPGGLTASEADRLRRGVQALASRPAERRPRSSRGPQQRAAEARRLRTALARLHWPLLRGGIEVCAECSNWDGQLCRGLLTPWPCPTADTARLDTVRAS